MATLDYGGIWNPFDPSWYQSAFDRYTSTAEELFRQDEIIQAGFQIPDGDGSKSSVFRADAVLNNSFSEEKLRNTLRTIYLNQSHRLKASNHDNTHFYQWHGTMKDMTLVSNTQMCELRIPTDVFIRFTGRSRYRISQYLKKWIQVEDILSNWDIFPWHCLLFINRRIMSGYEFRIDDRETILRFPYYGHWVQQDYSVDLYRFDTNVQSLASVSQYMMKTMDWKLPISYIPDIRVQNHTQVICMIYKNTNAENREDGNLYVDQRGDNLEFCTIKDGVLDLSQISAYNRGLILSEPKEPLQLGIFVPKFLHEYPILLPVDHVYRPYAPKLKSVQVIENNQAKQVYIEENGDLHRVMVDLNEENDDANARWNQLIRPVVLSDSFDHPEADPYAKYMEGLAELKQYSISLADQIYHLRYDVIPSQDETIFPDEMARLDQMVQQIYQYHSDFLKKNQLGDNVEMDIAYHRYQEAYQEALEDGPQSIWFQTQAGQIKDFWLVLSPMVYIPRELVDRYEISLTIAGMGGNRVLWESVEEYLGQHRYRRPIDALDFWTFEYDREDGVWRPMPLQVEHRFPDVYLLTDPNEQTPTIGRIFKAFFFYSDTMNVREPAAPITRPTASYDEDMEQYMYHRAGVYQDIFFEKFYWMGIQSIYQGILSTGNRWEVLEYVMDNPSYRRFDTFFLHTMEPYYKYGLATYLQHEDYGFPFDYAIDKMTEAIQQQFLGYQRVTNFELYLQETWIPSYFDYIVRILDDWDWESHLVNRPRDSMDTERIIPVLRDVQISLQQDSSWLTDQLNWILMMLQRNSYWLALEPIQELQTKANNLNQNMLDALDFVNGLDLEVLNVEEINHITELIQTHKTLIDAMQGNFDQVYQDAMDHQVYPEKQELLSQMEFYLDEKLPVHVQTIGALVQSFDMESFMLGVNDLRSYLTYNKENPDDISLIGLINDFNDSWGLAVKAARNHLFTSTLQLNSDFQPSKSYTTESIQAFITDLKTVQNDVATLRKTMVGFCEVKGWDLDRDIIDRLDYAEEILGKFEVAISEYVALREVLVVDLEALYTILQQLRIYPLNNPEKSYDSDLHKSLDQILEALSYLVGSNRKDDANLAVQQAQTIWNQWVTFVNTEQSVFEAIYGVSKTPNPFIEMILVNHAILEAIAEYLDTVNLAYKPIDTNPTYSDLYEVTEIELVNGGFLHAVGDHVYVPNLGCYKVTEVDGEIAKASQLQSLSWRATQFYNPMENQNPFDSTTDGSGLGIVVRPVNQTHTKLKNDWVVHSYGELAAGILQAIDMNVEWINPFKNTELQSSITQIQELRTRWNHLLKVYQDYMTPLGISSGERIIKGMEDLVPSLESFMEKRGQIQFYELITTLDQFLRACNSAFIQAGMATSNYERYAKRLDESYSNAMKYFGTGTTWNDLDGLEMVVGGISYEMELFYRKILEPATIDGLEAARELYQNLVSYLDSTQRGILAMWEKDDRVSNTIAELTQRISVLPNYLHADAWYRVSSPGVANSGSGYQIGDIVQIVPQLPMDDYGEPIHDNEEMILQDKILIRVTKVDALGGVLEVSPLMQYAIPYLMWGSRETITLVGTGTGLLLDTYSYQIRVDDLTILQELEGDTTARFDQNDMFAFTFDNVYDLPITYEVFLAGKQLNHVTVRHIHGNNHLEPNGKDIVYLNANEVMALQNSRVHVDAQHYFIYKIDKLEIVHPGAGYHPGQTIYVDAGEMALKLKVGEVEPTPFHGIASIDMNESIIAYEAANPTNPRGTVLPDDLTNIDDEYHSGYYDSLPEEGITKGATISLDANKYPFTSKRFDSITVTNRNAFFLYPDVPMPSTEGAATNGDPDEHWYQGIHVETNSPVWNRILPVIPVTDGIIDEDQVYPPDQLPRSEFQFLDRQWFHTEAYDNWAIAAGDLFVETYADLPKDTSEWPDAEIGKCVMVAHDETHGGHRMLYPLKTFVIRGYFVWGLPIQADRSCNQFEVDFMNTDSYPDFPDLNAQYPNVDWRGDESFSNLEQSIADGDAVSSFTIDKRTRTFIDELRIQDLSVFNMTLHKWEDLTDATRWKFEVWNGETEPKQWGFRLTLISEEDYSYDMRLYLNKTMSSQMRNSVRKEQAILNIRASISAEVNTPAIDAPVDTGRHLRIRKLFGYEQEQSYHLDPTDENFVFEMEFQMTNYMHFHNEIHLEDIKLYNQSAGRFENILDSQMFEVQFYDRRGEVHGSETQVKMVNAYIAEAGSGFMPGECWCYNASYDVHVFGYIETEALTGMITSFTPIHCPVPPKEDIMLVMDLYQTGTRNKSGKATVLIEFQTVTTDATRDSWFHQVTNRMAPVPQKFKIIGKYELSEPMDYQIRISKTPKTWTFIEPQWIMSPTFHISGDQIPQDRLYITTEKGRFPIVNPATGKSTLRVAEVEDGTDVTFLNLYHKYEELKVHASPYSMRSVYIQRRVPSHGFIDLTGKLNKPLNKQYFEFWMNGRLLDDEVTIISPTKLFLHGLTSLRNFEILEINRDSNEYFSDSFLGVRETEARPYPNWDYSTYLDDALKGTLEGDNYTEEEQSRLLTPVWPQVEEGHPEFRNYPPNMNLEPDILNRVEEDDLPLEKLDMPSYQYMIIDIPTLEGVPIADRNLKFEHFGFIPLTDEQIADLMNEEWADEINAGEIPVHNAVSDDEWYGLATRLFDEYGILVHNLDESVYQVVDTSMIRINTSNRTSRIVRRTITYDLE